jgi:hypothetical protein
MNIKYKIKEVKPNIFAVIVKDNYDRAMLFCRGQEYYESPNKKFRGKDFSIWDYMKWYSEEYGRGFSYGSDWSGFNIPFDILWKCYQSNEMETPYDDTMWQILGEIDSNMDINKKAYVIGADSLESDTFTHEVCHGLWYTNPAYKKEAKYVLNTIPKEHKDIFKSNLIEMGYTDGVIDDEIQAYLTTNWNNGSFGKGVDIKDREKYNKAFETTLRDFLK